MTIIMRTHVETVHLEDGEVILAPNGNARITATGNTVYLGPYDLAELLRIACGSDAKALEVIARNMREGHRFRGDDLPDRCTCNPEEPW